MPTTLKTKGCQRKEELATARQKTTAQLRRGVAKSGSKCRPRCGGIGKSPSFEELGDSSETIGRCREIAVQGVKALLAEELHRCAAKAGMAKLLQAARAHASGGGQISDTQLVIQMARQPVEKNLKGIRGFRYKLNIEGVKNIEEIALEGNAQRACGLRSGIEPVGITQQLKHRLQQRQWRRADKAGLTPLRTGIKAKPHQARRS